jgi:hypothetical protein
MLMPNPNDSPQTSTDSAPHASPALESMSADELRRELTTLRDRERQIGQLIGAKAPDRILHDLRNLLNEVQLLRILAEQADT